MLSFNYVWKVPTKQDRPPQNQIPQKKFPGWNGIERLHYPAFVAFFFKYPTIIANIGLNFSSNWLTINLVLSTNQPATTHYHQSGIALNLIDNSNQKPPIKKKLSPPTSKISGTLRKLFFTCG